MRSESCRLATPKRKAKAAEHSEEGIIPKAPCATFLTVLCSRVLFVTDRDNALAENACRVPGMSLLKSKFFDSAAAEDTKPFWQLIQQCEWMVYRVALRIVRNEADAED
jgi:hypothetical protein